MDDDRRCMSRAQVAQDVWKRCIRAAGHAEVHIWVESLDRVGGRPILATWTAGTVERQPRLSEIELGDTTPGAT